MEVVRDSAPLTVVNEHTASSFQGAPIPSYALSADQEGIEAIHPPLVFDKPNTLAAKEPSDRKTVCGLRWRWAILVSGVFLFVLVGGVVGGVVGSKRRHSSSDSANNAHVPQSTPSGNASTSNPIAAERLKGLRGNSSIAATTFDDNTQTRHYRVYYQDENDIVKESAWNMSGNLWYVSNENIGKAKSGSPIAVASSGSGYPNGIRISLFYLDEENRIKERVTLDQLDWSDGDLSKELVTADPASKLTALWHQHENCHDCPSTTVLVYQSPDAKLQLANSTTVGWRYYTLSANAASGSGLALTRLWNSTFTMNLQLYYQMESGQLSSLNWYGLKQRKDLGISSNDPLLPDSNGWQNRESLPLNTISPDSPIAAFSYGMLSNSLPQFIQVLSLRQQGAQIEWWKGDGGGSWQPTQTPPLLARLQSNASIGCHGHGSVYAVQDGVLKEFNMGGDGQTWSMDGDGKVPTL